MSLIKVRRTATLDSEAKDIQLPFIITFNNGKKEFREGYSAEEVRRRFDKGVAALYGGIKSVKLESEDKRDGKDSIADKEREYTRLYELAQKNITFHAAKGDSAKVAEWKRKADEYKRLAQEAENAAEARNAKDSAAADAKFKKGDKVRRGKQTGIVRDIEKEPYIEVKFTDQPVTVFVHESEIVAADSRAADADDSFAFGIGEKVTFKRNGQNGRQWGVELTVVDRRHTDVQNEYTVKDVMGAKSKWWESWLEKYSSRAGDSASGQDGNSEYELGMKVLKAVGKVEDEIVAGVRRAKQLVNNVPDEDVKRRLNRKLDDIAKIADSFDETFI